MMPYGDRTGPNGQGPLTGRGLGVCNDSNARFVGRGRRGGRGNRNFARGYAYNTPSLQDEKDMLKSRLEEIDKLLEKE